MTEKELRRMSRRALIEVIIDMKKKEIELQGKLDLANKKLEDRTIKLNSAGSIAEASLLLNGVFEAAQASADEYLQSLRSAGADAETIILEAEEKRDMMLEETERQCAEMIAAADEEIKRRKALLNTKIHKFLQAHPEIRLTKGEANGQGTEK